MTNLFHQLPSWLTAALQPKTAPTALTIHAFKHEVDGWMFNMLPVTWHEQLFFGDVLDQLAAGGNKLTLQISATPQDSWEAIHHLTDDAWGGGSVWHWHGQELWLCSWLKWFFWQQPETLWFTVK